MVIFIARDQMGFPVSDAEFVIGWGDIVTYPNQDYPGRFSMKLDRVYDPILEHGPYWAGFLQDEIAPEVVNFGVPRKHNIEIKIIYTQLEGGAR